MTMKILKRVECKVSQNAAVELQVTAAAAVRVIVTI